MDFRRAVISGPVLVNNGSSVDGCLSLSGATVNGEIDLSASKFVNAFNEAIDIRFCDVKGGLIIAQSCEIHGSLLLYGASIAGDAEFSGVIVSDIGRKFALDARQTRVRGSIFFNRGFDAEETINLFGAQIQGNVVVSGAHLNSTSGDALTLANSKINHLRIEDSTIKGRVSLASMNASEDVTIVRSSIEADQEYALDLGDARIRSLTFGGSSTMVGGINLLSAIVAQDIRVRSVDIRPLDPHGAMFNGNFCRCEGTFHWQPVKLHPAARVYLGHMRVHSLMDNLDRWPDRLLLEGFSYGQIVEDEPSSASQRLSWIRKQVPYRSQPFEHLVSMYRRAGDTQSSAEIAIGKFRTRRGEWGNSEPRSIWDRFLDLVSGYGYRPWRLVGMLAVLFAVGTAVNYWANENDGFCVASTNQASPAGGASCTPATLAPYGPALYSLETFLPAADFGQRKAFVPNQNVFSGQLVFNYSVIQRILAWIFGLLLALAPTNVLRRE